MRDRPKSIAGSPFGRHIALLALPAVAAFYAAGLVWLSSKYFRLSGFPINDDVYYFDAGVELLLQLQNGGLAQLGVYLWKNPLHAPVPAVVCAFLFGVFGVHDWLPYAANGALVLAMLLFVAELSRHHGLRHGAAVCLPVFALSTPLLVQSVIVFQPVFAASLAAALGTAAYAWGWPLQEDRKKRWAAILLWAFALLAKPTIAPQLLMSLFAVACLGIYAGRRRGEAWTRSILPYARNIAYILALVAPHYITAGPYLVRYIIAGTTQPPARFELDAAGHLLFYLTGPGGGPMFGPGLFLMAAVLLTWAVVDRPARFTVTPAFAFAVVVLLNFLVSVFNPHKHEHLGPPFQYLLLVATLMAGARLAAPAWDRTRWRAACYGVAALSILCGTSVRYIEPWAEGNWNDRKHAMSAVLQTLRGGHVDSGTKVFLTSSGFISVTSLWYQFARMGRRPPDISDLAASGDPAAFARAIGAADWVVATSPRHPEVFDFLPSSRIQGETLKITQADRGLELRRHLVTASGGHYYVFQRVENPARLSRLVFSDPATETQVLEGFYPVEGDGWRWCAKRCSALLAARGSGPHLLTAEVHMPEIITSRFREQRLTLFADGSVVGHQVFKKAGNYSVAIPIQIELPGGKSREIRVTLEVAHTVRASGDIRDLGVIIRSLRIDAVAAK